MVPACYPSKISSTTGLREAVVFALPSVTGLVRWTDYIPVKLVASADAALEGRTDAGGFIPMDMLVSNTGLMGWVDYLPVYVDNSATDAWAITATGFIPYAASGGGSSPAFTVMMTALTNATGMVTTLAYINHGSGGGGVIVGGISVSRLSGVAPLYVNFDYTGTTSSASANPAHECFFATDFGDSGAGVWANGVQSSGLTSKNAGYGPVTGHVYETPGTYHPQVVAIDGAGNISSRTATITVQDPNVVYAGALTICISHSGNFTGAPSGATQITAGSDDMYAAWNTHKASNKRILFCKADSWTASATISAAGLSNMIIGGYGTGVAHTFSSGTMVSVTPAVGVTPMFNSSTATDVKFCNFRVAANATTVAFQSISADDVQITWYKMEVRGATCAFSMSPDLVLNSLFKHEQTCIYECLHDEAYGYAGAPADTPRFTGASGAVGTPGIFTASGHPFKRFNMVKLVGTPPTGLSTGVNYFISASNLTANTFSLTASQSVDTPLAISGVGTCDVVTQSVGGGLGLYVALTKGGIMGSYFDNCNHGEQTVRIPYIHTSHINNNYIARPNQTKNALKIHSRGYENIKDIPGVSGWSEKFIVSANFTDLRGGYSYGAAIPNNGQVATQVGYSDMIIMVGSPSEGNNEWLRNFIVENNYTQTCLGNAKDLNGFITVGCPNATVRNNILDASVGDRTSLFNNSYQYLYLNFAGVKSTTVDSTIGVRIYNNTMYSNVRNAENADFVRISKTAYGDVDQIKVQNNLWYLPHATTTAKAAVGLGPSAAPTNVTNSNNTDSVTGGAAGNTPNFAVQPPVALADWRPTTGYAVDQGATVPVLRDFNQASRVGGTYDLGAVLP